MFPTGNPQANTADINTMSLDEKRTLPPQASASTNSATRASNDSPTETDATTSAAALKSGGAKCSPASPGAEIFSANGGVTESVVSDHYADLRASVRSGRCSGTSVDFLYAVRAGSMVKIGRAKDPVNRILNIQGCSPPRLRLVGLSHHGNTEDVAHRRFAVHRVHGEWFRVKGNPIPVDNGLCFGCAYHKANPPSRLDVDAFATFMIERAQEQMDLEASYIQVLDQRPAKDPHA